MLLKKKITNITFLLFGLFVFSLSISCGDEKMDKKRDELKEKYH